MTTKRRLTRAERKKLFMTLIPLWGGNMQKLLDHCEVTDTKTLQRVKKKLKVTGINSTSGPRDPNRMSDNLVFILNRTALDSLIHDWFEFLLEMQCGEQGAEAYVLTNDTYEERLLQLKGIVQKTKKVK